MSSSRSRPQGRERPLWFGVLRGHFNQDRICRNVIDLDETPIKITITDPVINARLADNATARDLAAQLPKGGAGLNRRTSTGRQPCTGGPVDMSPFLPCSIRQDLGDAGIGTAAVH